jgi:hypothetical protein
MGSTRRDYKRSGQDLLSGLECSVATQMAGEYQVGSEDKDTRFRLDRLEKRMDTLT